MALIAAATSSDINRFFALDIPLANDENRTHLILILLSTYSYNFIKFFNFF